jgi:lysyl-tRNA synthetase class II
MATLSDDEETTRIAIETVVNVNGEVQSPKVSEEKVRFETVETQIPRIFVSYVENRTISAEAPALDGNDRMQGDGAPVGSASTLTSIHSQSLTLSTTCLRTVPCHTLPNTLDRWTTKAARQQTCY